MASLKEKVSEFYAQEFNNPKLREQNMVCAPPALLLYSSPKRRFIAARVLQQTSFGRSHTPMKCTTNRTKPPLKLRRCSLGQPVYSSVPYSSCATLES